MLIEEKLDFCLSIKSKEIARVLTAQHCTWVLQKIEGYLKKESRHDVTYIIRKIISKYSKPSYPSYIIVEVLGAC
jgi:hypothetical protein